MQRKREPATTLLDRMDEAMNQIATEDAMTMLDQVSKADDMAHQVKIAKRWLNKHWKAGWIAAGGPGEA